MSGDFASYLSIIALSVKISQKSSLIEDASLTFQTTLML